ncbi:MAG: rluB [Sedimentibacter sp.]|nr:rluB [Sedimentibacter sp.]
MEEERLQKYIARCGISSRRKAEELILNGCVNLNGVVITELGTKINPEKDVVMVDNKIISETKEFIYIKLSSGLLLLTNDGDLANKLMHPKYNIYKTYIAEVDGRVSDEAIIRLKNGVKIEDYKTAPARVNLISHKDNSSIVQVSIYEGKNRQVRKMLEAVGHSVRTLKRISFGKINLGDLKPGSWVHLNEEEIKFLKGRQEE